MTDAQRFDEDLTTAVGHYMADIATALLHQGFCVRRLSVQGSCARFSSSDGGPGDVIDCEGSLVCERVGLLSGDGAQIPAARFELVWNAQSGWHLSRRGDPYRDCAYGLHRWMGGGLVPAAEEVVRFFSATLCDPSCGSEDRPYYRDQGHDLQGLLARLRAFTPDEEWPPEPESRLERAVLDASYCLAVRDLLSNDAVAPIPVHAGELMALARMMAYLDLDMHPELRRLSTAVVQDLQARFAEENRLRTPPTSLERHRTALDHARTTARPGLDMENP